MTISPEVYVRLGELLAYPHDDRRPSIDRAQAAIGDSVPEAVERLQLFDDALTALVDRSLEELHTRTFDVAASCDPYVSSQVFGQENYKRAQLMTGLVEAYAQAGFDRGTELPDHIALVLRFAPHCTRTEWEDLVTFCVRDAVRNMIVGLDAASNPYGHLFTAVRLVLDADVEPVAAPGAGPTDISLGILALEQMEEATRA